MTKIFYRSLILLVILMLAGCSSPKPREPSRSIEITNTSYKQLSNEQKEIVLSMYVKKCKSETEFYRQPFGDSFFEKPKSGTNSYKHCFKVKNGKIIVIDKSKIPYFTDSTTYARYMRGISDKNINNDIGRIAKQLSSKNLAYNSKSRERIYLDNLRKKPHGEELARIHKFERQGNFQSAVVILEKLSSQGYKQIELKLAGYYKNGGGTDKYTYFVKQGSRAHKIKESSGSYFVLKEDIKYIAKNRLLECYHYSKSGYSGDWGKCTKDKETMYQMALDLTNESGYLVQNKRAAYTNLLLYGQNYSKSEKLLDKLCKDSPWACK